MANEKRLIVAGELAERVWGIGIHFVGLRTGKTLLKEAMEKYRDAVLRTICDAPTVEATPVVHGHWIECEGTVCSVCNKHFFTDGPLAVANYKANYCPNCGARMDGGEET